MSLEQIETALKSLRGWPNKIGIIGGEPTVHPEFHKICKLLLDYNGRDKYGLWTTGGPGYEKNKTNIKRTFGFQAYNEHTEHQKTVCKHQPLTIACGEVIKDTELLKSLINNCWVQLSWCPSIAPKGAFFCEVAYALDALLEGPGGYPIKPDWWNKTPEQFKDQVDRYCHKCGMPIPINRQLLENKVELITPLLFEQYNKLGLKRTELKKDVEIFNQELTKQQVEKNREGWDPKNYRGDVAADGKYKY
jgi:hypothetical protein